MSHTPMSPDQFERLMTLPESHPDRMLAMRNPEFEALRLLHATFESPAPAATSAANVDVAGRELTARLTRTADFRAPARPGSIWKMPQLALAAAAAVALTFSAVWWSTRPAPTPALRSESTLYEFILLEPRAHADGIELRWTMVTGVEDYTVILIGPDLREFARLDVAGTTHLLVTREHLPASTVSGAELMAEVEARSGRDAMTRTPATRFRAP